VLSALVVFIVHCTGVASPSSTLLALLFPAYSVQEGRSPIIADSLCWRALIFRYCTASSLPLPGRFAFIHASFPMNSYWLYTGLSVRWSYAVSVGAVITYGTLRHCRYVRAAFIAVLPSRDNDVAVAAAVRAVTNDDSVEGRTYAVTSLRAVLYVTCCFAALDAGSRGFAALACSGAFFWFLRHRVSLGYGIAATLPSVWVLVRCLLCGDGVVVVRC